MAASTVPGGVAAAGPRLPARGRARQPGRAGRVPVRHAAAHRARVRAARSRCPPRACTGPRGTAAGPADRGDRVLPGARGVREHRLRGRAGRRGARRRAATPGACTARRCARPGRRSTNCSAGADALIVTVLAAGGTVAGDASAGGDDDAWDVAALAALDVPVLQALCLTSPRAAWAASSAALTPMDAAMQVAMPEFDGRLITVPFSFKEAGRGRSAGVRGGPGAGGAGGRDRAGARPAAAHPARAAAAGDHAVVLPDQARPGRQRGRAGHPGLGRGAAAGAARGGLRHRRRVPRGRRHADPRADRGGRARRRVAHRGAAGRGADAGARGAVRANGSRHCRRRCATAVREHWGDPPGEPLRRRRRDRAGRAAVRQRGADDPAAARVRREPGGHLPRPGPAAVAPLPGGLPLAGRRSSARTRWCTWASTAPASGCPARASACPRSARPTRCSATCR